MKLQIAQLCTAAARHVCRLALLCLLGSVAPAQSTTADAPTPVFAGEIAGRISPLDLGDPRQTRHFYTFRAQPGDLELTVEAENLEGDIDLFTATMRPLAKVTLYGGLNSRVTKTVFFRAGDSLILRVQARTPNDADGSYRVHLGGSFLAALPVPGATGAETASAAPAPTPWPAQRGVRRTTSTGARIEEPRSEAASAPEVAEPTPAPPAAEPAPARPAAARGRNTRARPPATRRGGARGGEAAGGRTGATTSAPAGREPSAPATSGSVPAETARTTPAPRTGARRGRAAPAQARTAETPPTAAGPAEPGGATRGEPAGLELPGTRLVLELRSGERIVREMSEVRRVTVERGQIVITRKSGQIERQPMANVVRMSIEP